MPNYPSVILTAYLSHRWNRWNDDDDDDDDDDDHDDDDDDHDHDDRWNVCYQMHQEII